ncbi:dicarboxylate/amino acid:cation symporter [Sporosarcina oncorhynchi]|uniref:Dicarboxylate/amino acid:cation symporter n=1 Tax=Sporosarcina oncorhynchi TaxID=3056444 RepID=A0ABZ0L6R5_9BACL|nr:dicarboxylate/amino acid:cation symporter [Sporosarcina sp. T2O-4]WOV88193.1 dicarboxylate/amino acid:cation symporter [Sporosarcina sp. T2O-4]
MIHTIWKRYRDTPFALKMTVGFGLGIIAGLIFGEQMQLFKPFGILLINLLSLVAIPVVFLTVVKAVDQMSIAQLGKMGWKLILYYAATTAAAVGIGVGLALLFKPGKNLTLPDVTVEPKETPQFADILLQMVPDNLFQAFASGDLMAIIFLAIIIGMTISSMRFSKDEKMQQNADFLDRGVVALNDLFFKLLGGILMYAPIGVFAISAVAFGSQGWDTFTSLLAFLGVFYLGLTILWLVVYTGFLKLSGNAVLPFFRNTKEAWTTAFFTSSSLASLPIAIKSAKKAGISEKTANFALPLGAIFNSDGGALRMGISIVFAANITSLQLSASDLFVIVLIGTLLSIGTAGVPAAGLVTLSAVLVMFGLPLEIVALIAGVDAIIGMGGTASNVVGDIVGAAVVDKTEKKDFPSTSILAK